MQAVAVTVTDPRVVEILAAAEAIANENHEPAQRAQLDEPAFRRVEIDTLSIVTARRLLGERLEHASDAEIGEVLNDARERLAQRHVEATIARLAAVAPELARALDDQAGLVELFRANLAAIPRYTAAIAEALASLARSPVALGALEIVVERLTHALAAIGEVLA